MIKTRLILKISGAALKNNSADQILSSEKLKDLTRQIKQIHRKYDIGIVIGGGNIWRGGASDTNLYRAEQAHYMGMIATIINSIALKEALVRQSVAVDIYSLLPCPKVAKNYQKESVNRALSQHKVVILAGGTGKPFFSTDTGSAKNAIELHAKFILMGKDGVDGVYSDDPKKNKNAIRFEFLSFKDAISKKLKVMDLSALKLCQQNNIDIIVFNIDRKNAIVDAIERKTPITIVSKTESR